MSEVPEPSESANDRDYCHYLEGCSNGPVGLLLLMVGLDAVYEAIDRREEKGKIVGDD